MSELDKEKLQSIATALGFGMVPPLDSLLREIQRLQGLVKGRQKLDNPVVQAVVSALGFNATEDALRDELLVLRGSLNLAEAKVVLLRNERDFYRRQAQEAQKLQSELTAADNGLQSIAAALGYDVVPPVEVLKGEIRRVNDIKRQAIADLEALRNAIRAHRDARGDDRCWMDDEELYKTLPEGYLVPYRDTAVELKRCEQYIANRRNPNTTYVSPEQEIARYKGRSETLQKRVDQANHSVFREWTWSLPLRMQAVMILGMRGPDGATKENSAKMLVRELRYTVLHPAFPKEIFHNNKEDIFMGSQTGRLSWNLVEAFAGDHDAFPHHWLLHFMHAAEIVGQFHPDRPVQEFWWRFYLRMCNVMHMNPESITELTYRLKDPDMPEGLTLPYVTSANAVGAESESSATPAPVPESTETTLRHRRDQAGVIEEAG